MRLARWREIAILGTIAAGIVLLVRLTQRSQKRKEMHDTAVATLTESGEFFFAPVDDKPASTSIAGS
ncbi:MAG TPA: hypothetical protein VES88_02165 [Gemmatimonadaceae bacterium]|nr:hypothetical protein [Gemmatimonadaceae bacterium]